MKDKIILLFILGLWSTLAAQGEILQWRDNKTFLADSTDVKVIEYDHEQQVDAGPKDSYKKIAIMYGIITSVFVCRCRAVIRLRLW